MFEVFLENKLLSGAFFLLLLLSILCQVMAGVIYRRMIKETENMSSTGNKLLKQCKLKFANCYQLNEGVSNIPVFVDKFMAKMSFMGISLTSIKHLSGQLMLLSVAVAGGGACREIMHGETVGKVLPYYIVSFLGLYVFFSISGLVDIQGKRERLKINLVDYLENHMVNKLRQSAIDWAEITGGDTIKKEDKPDKQVNRDICALREEIGLAPRRGEAETSSKDEIEERKERVSQKKTPAFSHKEKQELEELLREFFV